MNKRIVLRHGDCIEVLKKIKLDKNCIIVTDPPFNIGYHYNSYKDKMDENEYYDMLISFLELSPCVFIHYPENLYNLSVRSGRVPERVVSWIYNSNTGRQHRDIAFLE